MCLDVADTLGWRLALSAGLWIVSHEGRTKVKITEGVVQMLSHSSIAEFFQKIQDLVSNLVKTILWKSKLFVVLFSLLPINNHYETNQGREPFYLGKRFESRFSKFVFVNSNNLNTVNLNKNIDKLGKNSVGRAPER